MVGSNLQENFYEVVKEQKKHTLFWIWSYFNQNIKIYFYYLFYKQKYDTNNSGKLDTANFRTTLLKYNLGLSVDDINRIARYIEKDERMMIDYVKFIKNIESCKRITYASEGSHI